MSDLTVALILRAVDRLSGPVKRAGRVVGQLAREARRTGRQMASAGGGAERFARAQRQVRASTDAATRAVKRQAEALRRLARMREQAARQLRQQGLATAGKLAAAGAAAGAGAYGVKRLVEGAVNPLREVEKAKGELATLGIRNMRAWVDAAREAQKRISGMMAADFLRAGYDIKSALSNLTDEAAARMTLAAAWTAKATKASVADMTTLFSSAYGVFKSQFPKLTDAQFGDLMAGMTAAAVRQFKTTGAAMRQALQSASGAPAKVGVSMAEQYAVLGMLQQTMEAGMAGTALKQFAAKAADAQTRFRKKLGVNVRLLDKKGMVRPIAEIMAELRRAFGDVLDAREMATIQQAFGTEEAVRLVAALWGQEKALRANVRAMRDAASAGRQVAITMAMRGMANLDDRLVLLAQKWDLLKQQIGEAFQPVLERLIPVIGTIIDKVSVWLQEHPKLASGIATVVVGFGALLAVTGPLMMALSTLIGTLTKAAFAWRLFSAARLRGMAAEISSVGAAMDSVARKKWRLPRLIWRMAIAPLRWAAFIPRLAWRAFIAPLRWTATLIPRIPWPRLLGRGGLAAAGRLIGRLLGRKVIAGLALAIPAIGPVIAGALMAWDIWDTIIKPLQWDKYILPTLEGAWAAVRAKAAQAWASVRSMTPLDWARLALTGLPGVVARIIHAFTGIDLAAAGRRIMHSLWAGLKSVAAGLLEWAHGVAQRIAGALGLGSKTVRGMRTRSSAPPAPQTDIPMFARGGWMRAGQLALVGEQGPELLYPSRSAWVASNDNLRRLAERAARTRQALMQAAAAAVATPLISLPPQLLSLPPSAITAAGASAPRATTAGHMPATPQITVHMTINVQGQADARDIAREVDRALRRSVRSALHDIDSGGAA